MNFNRCATSGALPSVHLLLLTLLPSVAPADRLSEPVISKYTDLSSKACHLLQVDKETGSTLSECTGVAGYKLQIADDDERMSLIVISPDGQAHPLRFWDVITPAMSHLGSKAEWLVTTIDGRLRPVGLIARVNAREGGARRTTTSYLAVARISESSICVTARIPPGTTTNVDARKAALAAAGKPCLAAKEE